MGKPTGFLEWPRHAADRRPIAERLADFREVERPVDDPGDLTRQAGRCMDCGVPFCTRGCPLGNPIPEFNHGVWSNDWAGAWARATSSAFIGPASTSDATSTTRVPIMRMLLLMARARRQPSRLAVPTSTITNAKACACSAVTARGPVVATSTA